MADQDPIAGRRARMVALLIVAGLIVFVGGYQTGRALADRDNARPAAVE